MVFRAGPIMPIYDDPEPLDRAVVEERLTSAIGSSHGSRRILSRVGSHGEELIADILQLFALEGPDSSSMNISPRTGGGSS